MDSAILNNIFLFFSLFIKASKQKWYENNKEKINKYQKNYRKENADKIKKIKKAYQLNHLDMWRKADAIRRRKLYWFKLFSNPFPEEIKVDNHHINNLIVIPLPKKLHQKGYTKNIKKHRQKCNKIIEELYLIDLDKILSPNLF